MIWIDAVKFDDTLKACADMHAKEGQREMALAYTTARALAEELRNDTEIEDRLTVSTDDQEPTAEDADRMLCVLAFHKIQGWQICHYKKVMQGSFYTHWRCLPGRPGDETDGKEDERSGSMGAE